MSHHLVSACALASRDQETHLPRWEHDGGGYLQPLDYPSLVSLLNAALFAPPLA